MTTPRRRIWLYPDQDAIEVSLLGPLEDVGPVFARIMACVERWPGFRGVEIIGSGSTVAVLRAVLTERASYLDPLAEILAVLEEFSITGLFDWSGHYDSKIGMVGTW